MSKNNEDKIEYFKRYYEENREELLKKASEKVVCEECGSIVCKGRLSNHKKGKLHDQKVARYNMLKENKKLKKKLDKLNGQ